MTLAEIESMSIEERLQAMESLWDSLLREADSFSSPVWHGDVLAARQKRIDEGKANFVSLEDLKQKYQ